MTMLNKQQLSNSVHKGRSALIIGGGLAGLSAAIALAPRGWHVTILEARDRLGGRASSFTDGQTGQVVDACQHVSMGCCTRFATFCETVGVAQHIEPQPSLTFLTPDGRTSRFAADPVPAPFHLSRAFAGLHFLTWNDKLRIAYGLARLRFAGERDVPFLPWLRKHGQTDAAIARFWGLVLVSALNETVDRIGLRHARKVFVDGFLRDRDGFTVQLPTVPLGELYGPTLRGWLNLHNVTLRLHTAVRSLVVENGRVVGAESRDGEVVRADAVIAAVPFDRLLGFLPAEALTLPTFANLKRLELSPITSVHTWWDRPLTPLPHAVLVDCDGQWLFQRPGNYVQVVVSASRELRSLGTAAVRERIVGELRRLFPVGAELLRSRVVTEHAATFSAVPGVDEWRPDAASPLPGLTLAGDWTRTGWPATMEGAVRSGEAAAAVLDATFANGV